MLWFRIRARWDLPTICQKNKLFNCEFILHDAAGFGKYLPMVLKKILIFFTVVSVIISYQHLRVMNFVWTTMMYSLNDFNTRVVWFYDATYGNKAATLRSHHRRWFQRGLGKHPKPLERCLAAAAVPSFRWLFWNQILYFASVPKIKLKIFL